MKRLESITIYGELRGPIWMPAVECAKEFDVTFSPRDEPFTRQWHSLEDALNHITNDGDFQYCLIEWARMNVRWFDTKKKVYIEKVSPIPYCKLTDDYLSDNYAEV